MPLYVAQYETACMTRQALENLVNQTNAAAGVCRSRRVFASLTEGSLVWLFSAPDRETLENWLSVLKMGNYRWLARVDFEGEEGTITECS